MADRPAAANDRASEQQGQKGLNVETAGLNACSSCFNDTYKEMMKTQLGKLTGEELKPELLDGVEERLNKNGYKMEDLSTDPENYQTAISHSLTQAKDGIEESNRAANEQ